MGQIHSSIMSCINLFESASPKPYIIAAQEFRDEVDIFRITGYLVVECRPFVCVLVLSPRRIKGFGALVVLFYVECKEGDLKVNRIQAWIPRSPNG